MPIQIVGRWGVEVMRIIFMGTPAFSVHALEAIIKAGHEVVAVYSQPPRPSGRGQLLHKSPVHGVALNYNIPVFTPKSLKIPEEQERFAAHKADMAVVVAYGLLLPKPILDVCRCINIHASLLPRWRGAAPLQRVIMAGDKTTGVTIMDMDEGLDTGDILLVQEIEITAGMTLGVLHDALSVLGARLIVEAIAKIEKGGLFGIKQTGEATYAAKIIKEEAKIDWSLPGEQIIRNIMAFNPYPGAYFEYKGEKIKILMADFVRGEGADDIGKILDTKLAISCHGGKILPLLVQRQGKKIMPLAELLKGFRFEEGVLVSGG